MSLKPSLPVELLDEVFYFLRDDAQALRASADVNQNFADIIEKHLYHHVTLGSPEMTAAQLSMILVDSPHIITYIKSLGIHLSRTNSLSFLQVLRTEEEYALIRVLPQLLHLTALSLHANIEPGVPWSDIHLNFKLSFLDCIRSPTLFDVSINCVTGFPLSLLEESLQLKSLSLIGSFSSGGLSQKQGVVTFPHLQSLTIETPPQVVEWLDRTNFSQLRSLVIWMLKGTSADFIAGILTNSKSLTYLELHSPHRGEINCHVVNFDQIRGLVSPLDLSVVPHLQHLYFGVEFFSWDDYGISGGQPLFTHTFSTPIPWISQTLRTLFKLPTILLQSIIIDITVRVRIIFREISWKPFMATLLQFDSLTKVELRFKLDGNMPLDYESRAVETLKTDIYLASLIETGLLSIMMSSS